MVGYSGPVPNARTAPYSFKAKKSARRSKSPKKVAKKSAKRSVRRAKSPKKVAKRSVRRSKKAMKKSAKKSMRMRRAGRIACW